MWKKKDIYDKAIFGLFVFYILAMTWIILFKSVMPSEFYSIVGSRKINLIPFVDIIVGKPYSMFEIIGNAIIFIPFGIFTEYGTQGHKYQLKNNAWCCTEFGI